MVAGMSALASKLVGHSRNDEQRTPRYLWDALNRRFRFDLDAAASQANALTRHYSTVEGTFHGASRVTRENGLTYPWRDRRVFVNPPYSRPLMGQFIRKAIEEKDNAEIIVMLTKCDTSTENYRLLAANAHIEYLGRVRYEDEHGKPQPAATFASCIAILRPTEPKP